MLENTGCAARSRRATAPGQLCSIRHRRTRRKRVNRVIPAREMCGKARAVSNGPHTRAGDAAARQRNSPLDIPPAQGYDRSRSERDPNEIPCETVLTLLPRSPSFSLCLPTTGPIRVTLDMDFLGHQGKEKSITWYAPNVGKVKEVRGKRVEVLKSFTPGKD